VARSTGRVKRSEREALADNAMAEVRSVVKAIDAL
jgi:hypothetical protein